MNHLITSHYTNTTHTDKALPLRKAVNSHAEIRFQKQINHNLLKTLWRIPLLSHFAPLLIEAEQQSYNTRKLKGMAAGNSSVASDALTMSWLLLEIGTSAKIYLIARATFMLCYTGDDGPRNEKAILQQLSSGNSSAGHHPQCNIA